MVEIDFLPSCASTLERSNELINNSFSFLLVENILGYNNMDITRTKYYEVGIDIYIYHIIS